MAKRKVIANAKDFDEYAKSGELTNPTEKVTMNFLTLDFDKVDTSNYSPLELQSFNMLRQWKEAMDEAIIKALED